jgi:hypothetical protein
MDAQTSPVLKPKTGNHDPFYHDTPQSSVFSFLDACRAKDYLRAQRCLGLRGLDDDKPTSDGPKLTQRVQQVLDRDPRFDAASPSASVDGSAGDCVARDRDLADTDLADTFNVDGKPRRLLERITLRSGLQVWLFAPESFGLIPKLAAISSSSPIALPPQSVSWKVMDTSLWRVIAMIVLALLLAAASRWISRLAAFIADILVKRTRSKINNNTTGAMNEAAR